MAETEAIRVAETSAGVGGSETTGEPVSLPVVELLTGRGFITGKSGSGKSNSASVIAEKLLDSGFGLLIVDIDGEYYGLKEEYEILHAGGDEECDIQVTTEHAEKLATLALDKNVPIILDVSSYLDESEAAEVLTAVARHLFAKAKKLKQPFLLLVEEVHEYIPENGSVGECGKMLIKIGKRGRKHGLGICGISQRPADVKKDFITQCDWLLWHRLTWNNDTKVVRRIMDREYASAVENLDDGEGFLSTDWSGDVRRVQFYRKRTFDAGATPGLDDVQRPDLKSVSNDLVAELQQISEAQSAKEDRIAELREELDEKNSRIAELETELQDARDLSRMADQFVDALLDHVEGAAPGRTERERMRRDHRDETASRRSDDSMNAMTATTNGDASPMYESDSSPNRTNGDESSTDTDDDFGAMMDAVAASSTDDTSSDSTDTDGNADGDQSFGDAFGAAFDETGDDGSNSRADDSEPAYPSTDSASGADDTDAEPETRTVKTDASSTSNFSAENILSSLSAAPDGPAPPGATDKTPREEIEVSIRADAEFVGPNGSDLAERGADPAEESVFDEDVPCADAADLPNEPPLAVRELKAAIGRLSTKTREMLAFYHDSGPGTPLNAHFAAGGDGNRTSAYSHNRDLRTMGLIEHVGRGHYEYRLRDHLAEELPRLDADVIEAYAREIESAVFDS
jgi:TolA-binding protein